MVTYFNKKDLVDFGKYLFSEERRELFRQMSEELLEERLKMIHDADVDNFMQRSNKQIVVTVSSKDLITSQNLSRNQTNENSI